MYYIMEGIVPWYCGNFDDNDKECGFLFNKLHKKGVAKPIFL